MGKRADQFQIKQGTQFRCSLLLLWPTSALGLWSLVQAAARLRPVLLLEADSVPDAPPTPGPPQGLPRGPHICGKASPWRVTRDCFEMLWEETA